jgi:hypothetical protein
VTPAPNSDVILPAGTGLNLRYPGSTPLNLQTGTPQQEVLLVQTDVRDRNGNLIVPQGTVVIGRFETSQAGSRFVTQAISLGGQNRLLVAQSEALAGTRSLSTEKTALYSGAGALAGGLLGRFSGWGIAGGAIAGAAASYFTAPRPAVIQPDQVLQVQLLEDLR